MHQKPTPMRHRIETRLRLLTACFTAFAGISVIVASLHAQRPVGPEIPKGTNVLFGRVIDAGTDAPVGDAIVTLNGFFDSAGRPLQTLPRTVETPETSPPRSVMTNGDGYFFFRDLPPGRYAVSALAFGYISSTYPLRVVELAGSDKPVTIPLPLQKFAAIEGRVLDDLGEPLGGVPVMALRRATIGGRVMLRWAAPEVLTDDRGVYRLSQLPPGRYVVGVLSSASTLPASFAAEIDAAASPIAASQVRRQLLPGGGFDLARNGEGVRVGDSVLQQIGPMPPPTPDGQLQSYVTTFFPGTTSSAEASVITLESGEQRNGVDLPLRLAATVRVSGVVTGPGGPIQSLMVQLQPHSAVDPDSSRPVGITSAITDANGAFIFLAVTPGQYTLKAWRVILEETNRTPNDPPLWVAEPLTVDDTDITGLAVAMKPGIQVSGRIEFKGATTWPLANLPYARITLRPLGAQSWRPSTGWPGADGTFVTGGDPPGQYFVNAPPVPGWTLQTISRGGTILPDDVIELEGSNVSGLVITYSNQPRRVSGTVVDARGGADAEADVIVFPADTTMWRSGIISNRRVRMVHVTSSAAFELTDLAPGDYYVAAISQRLTTSWDDPQFLDRLIAGATKFTLREADQHTLQLKTITPRGR
jgi:hypothetical protein